MLNMFQSFNIPKITRNGYIDWKEFWSITAGVIVSTIAIALSTYWAVTITFSITHSWWNPPKEITKTIYVDQLTAAQNTYIDQCKKSINAENNPGVPDVHTGNWTCTYAK